MKGLLLTGLFIGLLVAPGFYLLWDHRRHHTNYEGTCQEESTRIQGSNRIEFEASCSFWPSSIGVVASEPISGFSDELSTQRDVFIFGGGGPACERAGRARLSCQGEVDADERFSGWIETDSGEACEATVVLSVSGAGCSDIAVECNDIGVDGSVLINRIEGCVS